MTKSWDFFFYLSTTGTQNPDFVWREQNHGGDRYPDFVWRMTDDDRGRESGFCLAGNIYPI